MDYKIIDVRSRNKVPKWGNAKKFIAIHYLGVTGENHDLASDGCGAHFYIYKNGTIYWRCDYDAIVWQVGTAGYYKQLHAVARNANTIGIEMCCNCDGNSKSAEDPKWWFTTETQEACVWLVKKLMKELNIPVENVLRHRDIVNKTCPAPYVHNNHYRTSWTWDEFKAKLGNSSSSTAIPITNENIYRVRKSWADEKSQIGAYSNYNNAVSSTPIGYSVFDDNGKILYTNTPKAIPWDKLTAKDLNGLSEEEKIKKVVPIYQQCQKETGMLASVGLAQFCLECGYGTTDLAQNANNCHGMKCSLSGNTWANSTWDGKSKYTKNTAEQTTSGSVYYVKADFRKYKTIKESVYDRAAYFIGAMNGNVLRYPNINTITDSTKQAQAIKDGHYATDVKYVAKLTNIIAKWNLTQYDLKGVVPTTPSSTSIQTPPQSKTSKTYRVQVSACSLKKNANNVVKTLKSKNFAAFIEKEKDGQYHVYCGSYNSKKNAENRVNELAKVGQHAIVKEV